MRRTLAYVVLLALMAPAVAHANGRFPAVMSISTQHGGDGQRLIAGTTFGALLSNDAGANWYWECEGAVGYSGQYDPTYAISSAGTLFATTPAGFSVSRDGGCSWSFAPSPLRDQWISDVQISSTGVVWVSTSSSGFANDVYLSRDDGQSFTSTGLLVMLAWWKSLRIAPSDPMRVYVSGYQLDGPADGGDGIPQPLLYRTDDEGMSWLEIPFSFNSESQLLLLDVSPTDPDIVFARINGTPADTLLRSDDGGISWTPVATFDDDLLGFQIFPDGQTVLAGSNVNLADLDHGDVRRSVDGGQTFTKIPWDEAGNAPRLVCLTQATDGSLFACGANWAPNFYAVGKSSDGLTWTRSLRFSQIKDMLQCPSASPEDTMCRPLWPGIKDQFGIGVPDAGPHADASTHADGGGGGGGGGCGCRVAATGGVAGALGGISLVALAVLFARRRPKDRRRQH